MASPVARQSQGLPPTAVGASTHASILQELEAFLRLRVPVWRDLLAGRALLNKQSKDDLLYRFNAIRWLANEGTAAALAEAWRLSERTCVDLDPNLPSSLWSVLRFHWTGTTLSPDASDTLGSILSRLRRAAKTWAPATAEKSVPLACLFAGSLNSAVEIDAFSDATRQYRQALRSIHDSLNQESNNNDVLSCVLKKALDPVPEYPDELVNDLKKLFEDLKKLFEWHRNTASNLAKCLARISTQPQRVQALLNCLRLPFDELIFSPLVELSCRLDRAVLPRHIDLPAAHTGHEAVVVPCLRGRLSGTLAAIPGSPAHPFVVGPAPEKHEAHWLWLLVQRVPEASRVPAVQAALFLEKQLEQQPPTMFANAPETLLQEWKEHGLAICELAEWPTSASSREGNLVAAIEQLKQILQTEFGLEFSSGEESGTRFQFHPRIAAGSEFGRDGLREAATGKWVAPPKTERSAGKKPEAVLEVFQEIPHRAKFADSLAEVLRGPKFWHEIRTQPDRRLPDRFLERLVNLINEMDDRIYASPADPRQIDSAAKTLDHWIHRLVESLKGAVDENDPGPDFLNIALAPDQGTRDLNSLEWKWSNRPIAQVIRLRRSISHQGRVFQNGELARSCGEKLTLLNEQCPEMLTAHGTKVDPRSPGFRNEAGLVLVNYLNNARANGRIDDPDVIRRRDQMLRVLNATLLSTTCCNPAEDDRIAVDGYEYGKTEVGKISRIVKDTLCFPDARVRLLHPLTREPIKAHVVLSRGSEPPLTALLRRLCGGSDGGHGAFILADVEDAMAAHRDSGDPAGLIRLGFLALNDFQSRIGDPDEGPDHKAMAAVMELGKGLQGLRCALIPTPVPNGIYTRAELSEQLQRMRKGELAAKDPSVDVLAPQPASRRNSRRDKGDIARIQSFTYARDGKLAVAGGRPIQIQWDQSLGARSPQAAFAIEAAGVLRQAPRSVSKGSDVYTQWVARLEALSGDVVYKKNPQSILDSNVLLVEVLGELDSVSDLIDVDQVSGCSALRSRILRFLQTAGAQIVPAWPLASAQHASEPSIAPEPMPDSAAQPGPLGYRVASAQCGVQEVLARNLVLGGKTLLRNVVCGEGVAEVPNEPWEMVRELWRSLRREGRRPQQLTRFLEEQSAYVCRPNPLNLIPIIAAAETMGQDRADREDPADVRAAIEAIEEYLARTESLRRIDFRRWQVFPFSPDRGYTTQEIRLDRRAPGLVVRILVPAYANQQNEIIARGRILITA